MFALLYGYQGALSWERIAKMSPDEREWYTRRMTTQLERERDSLKG